MKHGQVTIKDIARTLNISTSTVSRALRNLPDVNAETRKAVVALADKLDYYPDSIALSLVKKKTNILGVIVPDIRAHFFSSAISGIQEVAAQSGYNVMIAPSNESLETEIKNIYTLVSSRADGIIISCSVNTHSSEHFRMIVDKGIPLIFFDRVQEEMDVTKVTIDDYEGARLAVEHLVQQGCTRIAHLGGPGSVSICRKRLQGYLDVLNKHGLPVDPDLILDTGLREENARTGTKKLLELAQLPDAIFGINDLITLKALEVIKEAGLRIPEDIALVGFGDEPITTLVRPSLSTVNQFAHQLGRMSAKEALDQLSANEEMSGSYLARDMSIKPKLIVRQSSLRKG
jgi:DNA-binding LacI/PurR family transcriptional regulator